MTRIRSLLGFLAAGATIVCATLASADTLADVKARDKLVVGVKNDYPPYGQLDANGQIVGFEIELARYVANELLGSPDKIEMVPVVASNRIEFLQAGRVDAIFATLGVTAERGKVIDFTEEYVSAAGPSVLAQKAAKFTQWEQLKGQSLCGIQGSYFNKHLTETYGIQLVNFTALPEAYRALQNNRCVGLAFDDMTIRKKSAEAGWESYKIAVEPYEYLPMAGGVRKDDTAFRDAVNAAILKAEGEGKLVEWEAKYDMPASRYIAERAGKAKAASN